jgi:uridylate kinase
MGMLATVIIGRALQDDMLALEQADVLTPGRHRPSRCARGPSRSSAAAPSATSRKARRHFRAGTGTRTFTTDYGRALRAMEMQADVILKGTKWTASTPPTR